MKFFTLLVWELVATIRGTATFVSLTVVALASALIVGAGIATFSLWAPFSAITPTFPGRTDPSNAPTLLPIIGEFRGGVAFYVILVWVIVLTAILAPALSAGMVVRDRRTGRLDRLLTDAARAEILAAAKWLAGLIPLGLILLAAAPAVSFAWLVGGLDRGDALTSILVVAGTGCSLAAIALLCSSLARTEVVAMLLSYIGVAAFLFGPLLLGIVLGVIGLRWEASVAIAFSPLVAVLSAQGQLTDKLVKLLPTNWPSPPSALAFGASIAPAWQVDVVVYLLIALILIWLTAVVLEPFHPLKTWRLRTAVGRRS